jgi:hypothetical protein
MATFLLYVYPKMKGKRGRQWASPRSAFAYVLAIIRIFREWKVILPPAKVVQGELHGLLRAFVVVYGTHALMPQRREPFRFAMVQALLSLGAQRLGARSFDPSSPIGWAFRGMLAVGWVPSHRPRHGRHCRARGALAPGCFRRRHEARRCCLHCCTPWARWKRALRRRPPSRPCRPN